MKGKFNIRVYGILINNRGEVLVVDECRMGMKFTKFPGGGLEQGDGTVDTLKRECLEELGQEVEVKDHFYTTDFYQASAFDPEEQLISIYYFIDLKEPLKIKVHEKTVNFQKLKEGGEAFRWIPLDQLSPDDFKFPVDKVVADKLKHLHK